MRKAYRTTPGVKNRPWTRRRTLFPPTEHAPKKRVKEEKNHRVGVFGASHRKPRTSRNIVVKKPKKYADQKKTKRGKHREKEVVRKKKRWGRNICTTRNCRIQGVLGACQRGSTEQQKSTGGKGNDGTGKKKTPTEQGGNDMSGRMEYHRRTTGVRESVCTGKPYKERELTAKKETTGGTRRVFAIANLPPNQTTRQTKELKS